MKPIRFIAFAAIATATILVICAVAGVDVSALRDFEHDATMVRAPYHEGDRYSDPSPYSMWLPSDLFVWDSVRSGNLPLWNRLQGGGYSSLDAVHEGVFHPLRWLTALVPRRTAPTALIVLILATAMTGMFVLVRLEFGFSAGAAAVASIGFAFSSVLISMVHFSGAILPLAHIPWIVLFLRRSASAAAFFGLVVSLALLFICGHPLLEVAAAMTAGGIALADGIAGRSWRPVLRYAVAGACGVLMAAPAWLPAMASRGELWSYKTETARGVSYVTVPFVVWLAAVRAMVVDTFSKGCCIDLDRFFLYVGIPVLILAAVGIGMVKQLRPIAVLLLIAFLIAVPGPWMLPFRSLRPLAFFKPWYLIGSFTFYLMLLVAGGFDALWRAEKQYRVIAVALSALLIGISLLRAREVLRPRFLPKQTTADAIRFLAADRDLFRVAGLWGQTHMPNASRLTGIEDVRLAGPVLTRRYHLWWQLVDRDVLARSYPTTRMTDRLESPLVGDFNVKYVLQSRLAYEGTFRNNPDERSRDRRLSRRLSDLPLVFRTPWVEVRRNSRWYRPRAHFAEAVLPVPSLEEAVRALIRDPGLPRRAAVVETEDPATVVNLAGTGTVVLRYPNEHSVVMDVRSDRGGLVVLHDTVAGGWSATVDGKPADIVAVNVLSRGVFVSAGSHRIEMRYLPPVLVAAAGISAATFLAVLLPFVRTRARRS